MLSIDSCVDDFAEEESDTCPGGGSILSQAARRALREPIRENIHISYHDKRSTTQILRELKGENIYISIYYKRSTTHTLSNRSFLNISLIMSFHQYTVSSRCL